MLFLWCFSAPYWEKILAASAAHCTIEAMLCFETYGIDHSYEGKVQIWVRRRSYYLNLCEAHGLNTCGQLLHLMKNDKKHYYAKNFVLLVVQGFIDSFFLLHLTYVSDIVIAGLWKFYYYVQQQYEVRIWVNKNKEKLATNPVTGRRTSTGKSVTAWIAMRKGVTGKEFTLTSWKTEVAKCWRARTTWTLCNRRTGEAILRAAKFGRIDNSRA